MAQNNEMAQYNHDREKLAELAHQMWSDWMRYLFSKCIIQDSATIPAWAVRRWRQQMNTTYRGLSEDDKESDRKVADKILAILGGDDDD